MVGAESAQPHPRLAHTCADFCATPALVAHICAQGRLLENIVKRVVAHISAQACAHICASDGFLRNLLRTLFAIRRAPGRWSSRGFLNLLLSIISFGQNCWIQKCGKMGLPSCSMLRPLVQPYVDSFSFSGSMLRPLVQGLCSALCLMRSFFVSGCAPRTATCCPLRPTCVSTLAPCVHWDCSLLEAGWA